MTPENYNLLIKDSEAIRDKETKIFELRSETISLEKEIADFVNEHMRVILDAKDEKDKPLYSNEKKRQARLEEILDKCEEYQKNVKHLDSIKETTAKLSIELSHDKRVFDITKTYLSGG